MDNSRPLFLYFRIFKTEKQMLYIKVCRCQDSNHGPVELEATSLPTEPEPLKYFVNSCFEIYNSLRVLEDFSMELAPHWLCVVSCRLVSCGGRGVRLGHEKTWSREELSLPIWCLCNESMLGMVQEKWRIWNWGGKGGGSVTRWNI